MEQKEKNIADGWDSTIYRYAVQALPEDADDETARLHPL